MYYDYYRCRWRRGNEGPGLIHPSPDLGREAIAVQHLLLVLSPAAHILITTRLPALGFHLSSAIA